MKVGNEAAWNSPHGYSGVGGVERRIMEVYFEYVIPGSIAIVLFLFVVGFLAGYSKKG